MPAAKLSPRQELFIGHYLSNGFNGTQAAISAGYAESGARTQAVRLLAMDNIQAVINRKQNAVAVVVDYSHGEWLRETLEIGREARERGAFGPALKAQELVGRHIGALQTEKKLDREQAEFFSYLGAQMERFRSQSVSASDPLELPEAE